jgi:hypothetical protein
MPVERKWQHALYRTPQTESARVMHRYSAEAVQPEIDKDKRIGKAEARPHPGNPSWIESDAQDPRFPREPWNSLETGQTLPSDFHD